MIGLRKVAALAACAALVATACSSSAATPTPTAAPTSALQTAVVPTVAPSPTPKPVTVGVVLPSMSDVAQATLLGFLNADAAARGWTIDAVDANGSVDTANADIQNFVTKKVDAIITSVFTSDSLQSGIKAATAAGIPVITHGGGAGPGILADFEAQGGDVTTRRMVSDFGNNGSAGQVLAFTYSPGFPCLIREQAFDQVLSNYPNIKVTKQQAVIPGFAEGAAATTSAWLASHPAGKGPYAIWACWDGPAEGAASAVKQAGRTDVKIYGHNGDVPALVLIKQGLITFTVWYDYKPTAHAELNAIAQILQVGIANWTPGTFQMGFVGVDASTLDQFLKDHPDININS